MHPTEIITESMLCQKPIQYVVTEGAGESRIHWKVVVPTILDTSTILDLPISCQGGNLELKNRTQEFWKI